MSYYCPGCGNQGFSFNGLARHLTSSQDPRCHKFHDDNYTDDIPEPGPSTLPRQHLYGDEKLHSDEDISDVLPGPSFLPTQITHPDTNDDDDLEWAQDDENVTPRPESPGPPEDEQSDSDSEQGEGQQWEPDVDDIDQAETPDLDNVDMDEEERRSLDDRIQAEKPLWRDPIEVPFGGEAGAAIWKEGKSNNAKYRDMIDATENPNIWHPFRSKLEWEFARWAKMRGPGSTAVTELLKIDGVMFLCSRFFDNQR